MEHSTPIRSMANQHETNSMDSHHDNVHNFNSSMELDEIDVENLRLVFGSEDVKHRKAHELRELWMEKTQFSNNSSSNNNNTNLRIPRFLLDPKNKDHVAPHTVALQLLLGRKGKREGDGLYKRVPRSEQECNNHNSKTFQRDVEELQSFNDNENNKKRIKDNDTTSQGFGIFAHLLAVVLAMVTLSCQFTLEVLGGAGAIWGCAEIARLRKGGPIDPSWDFFTWAAVGLGIACLLRFLLVHPFFPKLKDPGFAEKYKLQKEGSLLQLLRAVASDPVLFLHPTKGLAFKGCCGCVCICCGNQWSSFGNSQQEENHLESPRSLGKPSPQRSTWDMSDDESDN